MKAALASALWQLRPDPGTGRLRVWASDITTPVSCREWTWRRLSKGIRTSEQQLTRRIE